MEAELRGPIEAALPETKPAFTDLIVADDGQLWVKRPAKRAEADTTTWWVLRPGPKTVQEVRLPSEVDVEVVQDGRAYGTTTTENGAPALVRYRVGVES
jgi:hypothetical protein